MPLRTPKGRLTNKFNDMLKTVPERESRTDAIKDRKLLRGILYNTLYIYIYKLYIGSMIEPNERKKSKDKEVVVEKRGGHWHNKSVHAGSNLNKPNHKKHQTLLSTNLTNIGTSSIRNILFYIYIYI